MSSRKQKVAEKPLYYCYVHKEFCKPAYTKLCAKCGKMENDDENDFITELFDVDGKVAEGVSEHLSEYRVKRVCQALIGIDPYEHQEDCKKEEATARSESPQHTVGTQMIDLEVSQTQGLLDSEKMTGSEIVVKEKEMTEGTQDLEGTNDAREASQPSSQSLQHQPCVITPEVQPSIVRAPSQPLPMVISPVYIPFEEEFQKEKKGLVRRKYFSRRSPFGGHHPWWNCERCDGTKALGHTSQLCDLFFEVYLPKQDRSRDDPIDDPYKGACKTCKNPFIAKTHTTGSHNIGTFYDHPLNPSLDQVPESWRPILTPTLRPWPCWLEGNLKPYHPYCFDPNGLSHIKPEDHPVITTPFTRGLIDERIPASENEQISFQNKGEKLPWDLREKTTKEVLQPKTQQQEQVSPFMTAGSMRAFGFTNPQTTKRCWGSAFGEDPWR